MNLQLTNNLEWSDALVNDDIVRVPVGWTVQCFNDLGSFKTGKDHKSVAGVNYPVYGSSSRPMSMWAASPIYAKDSFIIGRKGTIDKPFFVKGPFWCVDTAMYFENDAVKADIRFLYYKAKAIPWLKYNSGSTIPSLTQSLANSLEMALPKLEEQTAIANILSDQEALVAHHNDLIALHEKRLAYLSDELLSGRLRLKKSDVFTNIKWTSSSMNGDETVHPEEWSTKTLRSFSKIKGGKRIPKGFKLQSEPSPYPYIRISDVEGKSVGTKNLLFASEEAHSGIANYTIKSDDLFVSIVGTIGLVGKIPTCLNGALLTENMAKITDIEGMNLNYILYALASEFGQKAMHRVKVGTTQGKLPLFRLSALALLAPPLEEQTLIAKVLSEQEALIAEYKKLRDAEKKRFDWLSDALLSGTYRVKMEA